MPTSRLQLSVWDAVSLVGEGCCKAWCSVVGTSPKSWMQRHCRLANRRGSFFFGLFGKYVWWLADVIGCTFECTFLVFSLVDSHQKNSIADWIVAVFFSTPLHPGRNCTSCWMTWNKVRTETIAKWQVSNGQVAAEQRQALDPCAGAVQGRREKEFTSFRTRLPGHQTSWCTWYKYTIVFAYDFSMFFMCFLCVAVG